MSANLGIELALVGMPERHAPDRIVHGEAVAGDVGGKRVVIGVEGRQLGAERYAGRAGEGGEIDDEVRAFLVGQRQGVARISRPSASVLPISTVMPLRLGRMSPGRKALLEMEFSTAGIEHAQAHRAASRP